MYFDIGRYGGGYGSPQAVTGSGYKEIQGKKYLKLQKAGETDYNYTVRENGVIYNDTTNQPTEYSLNSNFEILKDNVLQTVKQKSSRSILRTVRDSL